MCKAALQLASQQRMEERTKRGREPLVAQHNGIVSVRGGKSEMECKGC